MDNMVFYGGILMESCEGCVAPCIPESTLDPATCPCVKCIVKVMCTDSCDTWDDWFHLYEEECHDDEL